MEKFPIGIITKSKLIVIFRATKQKSGFVAAAKKALLQEEKDIPEAKKAKFVEFKERNNERGQGKSPCCEFR